MNIKRLLAEVGDSGLRDRFYENLIDMLAVEAEFSCPDKVCPGPEYDAAINRLSMIIKVKGKIHAFYNLNCRWGVVPGARIEGEDSTVAAEFFKGLFQELEADPTVRQRVCEIVASALGRVKRGFLGFDQFGQLLVEQRAGDCIAWITIQVLLDGDAAFWVAAADEVRFQVVGDMTANFAYDGLLRK